MKVGVERSPPIEYKVHRSCFIIHTNGVTLEKDTVRFRGLHTVN